MPEMEFKYKPYRVVPLGRIIVCKLYHAHVNDHVKSEYTPAEIAGLFSVPMSRNLVGSALEVLRGRTYSRDGLVTRHRGANSDEYRYKISEAGILMVERHLRNKNTDIAHYFERGDDALDDIAGLNAIFMTSQEAWEVDPWTPLEIDRSDPAYVDTVNAVEQAIETIRGDNGFASTHPDQRNAILASLEDGLKWFKERTPSRAQIYSMLIAPLQWLSTNFSKVLLGEAAKKAAQLLVDYIHSLF